MKECKKVTAYDGGENPAIASLYDPLYVGRVYFIVWRNALDKLQAGFGEYSKKKRFNLRRYGGSVDKSAIRFVVPCNHRMTEADFRAVITVREVGPVAKTKKITLASDRRIMGDDRDKNGGLINLITLNLYRHGLKSVIESRCWWQREFVYLGDVNV